MLINPGHTPVNSSGDAYSVSVPVDLATPDGDGNARSGFYQAFSSYSIALGSFSGTFTAGFPRIVVTNAINGISGAFEIDDLSPPSALVIDGLVASQFIIAGLRGPASAIPTDALAVPTDLTPFTNRQWVLLFADGVSAVAGTVTSIQVLPEPSLGLLLAAAAIGLASRRRS